MIRYRLLISLLSIPVIFYTLWVAIRNKDYRYFRQRLGLGSYKPKNNNNVTIWVHAASVGEVNAAIPLIQRIIQTHSVVLTTNTPSSALRAKNIFSDTVSHYYCPIDWRWAINKLINNAQLQQLFIIETELWPNLFSVCRGKKIPVSILNGRISEKTLHAARWIKKRYAECLQIPDIILTRNNEDSQRFIALGADDTIVKTTGNIKYYPNSCIQNIEAFSCIKTYVLAASTREDEEQLLVSAWLESKNEAASNNLLIIVPRHPHRLHTISSQLARFNLKIAVRSHNDTLTHDTDIYIADTFGELVAFIKGAEFVLMGGSFVNKGGQNILEVAHAKKTVVFGPYMANFQDEAKLFTEQQAGIQVSDIKMLPGIMTSLLRQPEKIRGYQNNATQLMLQQKNVLDDYINEINKTYPGLGL